MYFNRWHHSVHSMLLCVNLFLVSSAAGAARPLPRDTCDGSVAFRAKWIPTREPHVYSVVNVKRSSRTRRNLECSHRHQPFELSCIVQYHSRTVLYLLREKIQLGSVQTKFCALKHFETDRHPDGTGHGRHNPVERRVGHHGVGGPRMQRWSRLRDTPMVLPHGRLWCVSDAQRKTAGKRQREMIHRRPTTSTEHTSNTTHHSGMPTPLHATVCCTESM